MAIGTLKKVNAYESFLPYDFPLPGGYDFSYRITNLAMEASLALGKINGIAQTITDRDFFLFMYLRKDASASSEIEGTRATMIQSIEKESGVDDDNQIPEDVDDIIKYVNALNEGIERMKNFPLSLRFIRELHKQLTTESR